MAFGDLWNRTLVYFGIAEEDEDWEDDDGYAAEESLEQTYRERPNVRRLTPRRRGHEYDDWTESGGEQTEHRVPAVRPSRAARPQMEVVPNPHNVRVLNIRPYVTGKNQITLDLQVGAQDPDSVIGLYKAIEQSSLFGEMTPLQYQPPSQSDPLYRYRFTVNYAQKL